MSTAGSSKLKRYSRPCMEAVLHFGLNKRIVLLVGTNRGGRGRGGFYCYLILPQSTKNRLWRVFGGAVRFVIAAVRLLAVG